MYIYIYIYIYIYTAAATAGAGAASASACYWYKRACFTGTKVQTLTQNACTLAAGEFLFFYFCFFVWYKH
jgi:hypothetical protein